MLAIDPTSRGFGFVILETPDRLLDWGLRQRLAHSVTDLRALLDFYRPHILVVENCSAPGARRGERARQLIAEATAMAIAEPRIAVRTIAAHDVRRAFKTLSATNKSAMAATLVEQFPELAPHLPRRRKIWMSEDERMAVFDALALVIVSNEGLGSDRGEV